MKEEIKHIAFPIPQPIHKKLKTIASAQGKTIRGLILELANQYFQLPENQKILAHIGK